MATNKLFVAVVLIVICLNIDSSKSREITSKREIKFDDICEIKFYSERNFIVEQDNFEKTTAHRRRKTDRSMETLGKQAKKTLMKSNSPFYNPILLNLLNKVMRKIEFCDGNLIKIFFA